MLKIRGKYKVICVAVLVVFFILLPLAFSYALTANIPCPPGIACPGTSGTGINSVNDFIATVINWLIGISFGIAVLFLIIGGFRYIVSGGDVESAEAAKNTIINAIIGIIIIILSYVIINAVVNLLTRPSGTGP